MTDQIEPTDNLIKLALTIAQPWQLALFAAVILCVFAAAAHLLGAQL